MIYIGTAAAILLPVLGLGVLSLCCQKQSPPGEVAGELADCPESPNCVCSCDESESHQIEPISYQGDDTRAMQQLSDLLEQLPRSTVVTRADDYRHFVVRSAIFRFPDDVEILQDTGNKRFHIRSASRAGKSDLGVNRDRVQKLRKEFQEVNQTN